MTKQSLFAILQTLLKTKAILNILSNKRACIRDDLTKLTIAFRSFASVAEKKLYKKPRGLTATKSEISSFARCVFLK